MIHDCSFTPLKAYVNSRHERIGALRTSPYVFLESMTHHVHLGTPVPPIFNSSIPTEQAQTTISDLVQIPPFEFYKRSLYAVEDKINEKYSNKVRKTLHLHQAKRTPRR